MEVWLSLKGGGSGGDGWGPGWAIWATSLLSNASMMAVWLSVKGGRLAGSGTHLAQASQPAQFPFVHEENRSYPLIPAGISNPQISQQNLSTSTGLRSSVSANCTDVTSVSANFTDILVDFCLLEPALKVPFTSTSNNRIFLNIQFFLVFAQET